MTAPGGAHLAKKVTTFLSANQLAIFRPPLVLLINMTREFDKRCDLNHPVTQVTIFHRSSNYECNAETDEIKHQNSGKPSIWNLLVLYNPRKRFQNSLKEGLPWRRVPPPELAKTAACAKTREHRGLSARPRWPQGKAARVRRPAGHQPAGREPAECYPAERLGLQ